jgi:predicted alpha/beta-fold hydrolase
MSGYRPAWWLRNPHAQTIWGKFARQRPKLTTRAECLDTPDGDAVELLHLDAPAGAPRVLLLHGLEGSSRSHYVGGVMLQALTRGWGATLMLFRGCGSAVNRARRFYHSGETSDLDFVFGVLAERHRVPWFLTGVSLGGNVLLKWLGERRHAIAPTVRAAAAVSVPFDLEAGARHIGRGFARVYDRSFVRSLRRKALAKLALYPDLFDRARLARARTIFDFDDTVTAPVHGFADARDYYEKSSSLRFIGDVRVPTLLLSSRDDPFLPAHILSSVERAAAANTLLTVEFHPSGGHVGFVSGRWPWRAEYYAETRVFGFFDRHLTMEARP